MENLTLSENEYIRDNAKKTLKILKENSISKSNLRNNLFLLMLLENNISIGKFRSIFYAKK